MSVAQRDRPLLLDLFSGAGGLAVGYLPPAPPCGSHEGEFYSPAGHGDPNWKRRDANPHLNGPGYADRCRKAMGIDWMNRDELAQAVPPAYSEWIGKQLLSVVEARRAA